MKYYKLKKKYIIIYIYNDFIKSRRWILLGLHYRKER